MQQSMTIVPFNQLDQGQLYRASYLFSDSFYEWFSFFSKDRARLAKAFVPSFDLSRFYALVREEVPVAIACLSPLNSPSVRMHRRACIQNLGLLRGGLAYTLLRREFGKRYPIGVEGDFALEFVATASEHRRRGYSKTLIGRLLEDVVAAVHLEVASTNAAAMDLYTSVGFLETLRIENKHANRSGFSHYVYMTRPGTGM